MAPGGHRLGDRPLPGDGVTTRPAVDQVTHTRYVARDAAHYGGNLVDGAFVLGLFGDVATHLSILNDGSEGLFAGYQSVEFSAPVRGGDVIEVRGELVGKGRRSRQLSFAAYVLCRACGADGRSEPLEPPLLVAQARGTVVAPPTSTAQNDQEARLSNSEAQRRR